MLRITAARSARVVRRTLALVASLVCANRAHGQAAPADPLLAACPAGASPRIDTTQVLVAIDAATAWQDSSYTDAQRHQIRFYADAIARHFTPPATLGDIPVLVDLPAYYEDGADDGGRSALGGRLVLIVRRDGRLKMMAWEYAPLATPLALAVVQAAQQADSAGDFDGIMRANDAAPEDTLALDIRSRLEGEPAPFPLMRARLPGYRGETLVMLVKRGQLVYPTAAANQHVGTRGEVRFVVGTDGRAVPSLIQVTRAGYRDFVPPMRRAILGSTFQPATSGGCNVPALVRQRFSFTIPR